MDLDLFFFQSWVQTKIAERSCAGTTLIATSITKDFAKSGGVDTGALREGRSVWKKGEFFRQYVYAWYWVFVLMRSYSSVAFFFLSVPADGSHTKANSCPTVKWIGCWVCEGETNRKKKRLLKKSRELKQHAWSRSNLHSMFTDNVNV